MRFSILNHLDTLTPDGGSHSRSEGSFHCPVCGANNFKVDLKRGAYHGWSCHCTDTEQGKKRVRAAIAPFWSKPVRPKQRREWTYTDFQGKPIVRVNRIDDGAGQRRIWQTSLIGGEQPVEITVAPYRFQECRRELDNGAPRIFWVEGEPAVDALWSLGLPATTTAQGCNGYKTDIHRGLFPADRLVICPDQDMKGIAYADAIARDYPEARWLYANPDSYLWERLPEAGGCDVADWIETGATAEQILAAIGSRRELPINPSGAPAEQPDSRSLEDIRRRLTVLANEGRSRSDVQIACIHLAEQTGRQPRELERMYDNLCDEEDREKIPPENLRTLIDAAHDHYHVARLLPTLGPELERAARQFNQSGVVPTVPLLSVAASRLHPKTRLHIGGSYHVHPILNSAIVTEPGAGKSSILRIATAPLVYLQAKAFEHYQKALTSYEHRRRKWEALDKQEKALTPPQVPKLIELYVADATTEAISGIITGQPDCGLLVVHDELSAFFDGQNQYRGGRGTDGAFYRQLYDGTAVKSNRASRGVQFVAATSVSVTGTIQPDVLSKHLSAGDPDGMANRFLWLPMPMRRLPAPGEGGEVDLQPLLVNCYQAMSQIPSKTFTLSTTANRTWSNWHYWMQDLKFEVDTQMERVLYQKASDRAGRIALVAHCLKWVAAGNEPTEIPTEISDCTLQEAIAFTIYCTNQTRLLYADMGVTNELSGHLLRVWQWIQDKGFSAITVGDLQRSRRIKRGKQYAKSVYCRELLTQLVTLGYLKQDGSQFCRVEKLEPELKKVEPLPTAATPNIDRNISAVS